MHTNNVALITGANKGLGFEIARQPGQQGANVKVNSVHPGWAGWVKTGMGSERAPMEVVDGAKTAVTLALLSDDGPSGGFLHMGETLPW